VIHLTINGKAMPVDVPPDVPLLWVIREECGLTGTKYGCGMALCGACTVHLDGSPVRSCVTPVSEAVGKSIVTIEGIGAAGLTEVQRAWIAESVPQCGYCQPGQIMSAVCLLRAKPDPTEADIEAALSANLCRCGTYVRIRLAVRRAAVELAGTSAKPEPKP